MENYSHPDIYDILQTEGNSVCADCGEKNPKWASMNNGIFLCLKCAGIHRSFGMSISLIRSLQIDSWTENQLLFLTKGGNNNFKKNLEDFNIDVSSASLDIKYKSKAADYYRRFLKNEVDRESDPNYVPTQIVKPELNIAQEIIEVNEENKEEKPNEEKKEEKKPEKKGFLGLMSSVLTKMKEGTTEAAKKVEKGFVDLKLGEKFKTAGNAIADAAKTSGHFIADKTSQAVNSEFVQNISKKTKEGVSTVIVKTKTLISKEKPNENEENKTEVNVKKDENEEKKEENKEENNEVNKEENKEEKKENEEQNEPDRNLLVQDNTLPSRPAPEERAIPEENLESMPPERNQDD